MHLSFWTLVTRLGEAQLLLPALLAATGWLVWRARAPGVALAWWGSTGAAALVTTATKIAFIGWGVGYAPWDYTGLSGHAMFAAAILPLLARESVAEADPRWHAPAVLAGLALAALIALSRVRLGAHSASEAGLGFTLGALASLTALALVRMPRTSSPKLLLVGIGVWLALATTNAPPSRTHDWVTAISIRLAGRDQPYQRGMMHLDWRRGQATR